MDPLFDRSCFRVPAKLKYLVFEVLAKLLCIKLTKEKRRRKSRALLGGGEEERQSPCVFCLGVRSGEANLKLPVSEVVPCSLGRVADRLEASLELHHTRQEEEERRNDIKTEWQHCALVIDRFNIFIDSLEMILFSGSCCGSSF